METIFKIKLPHFEGPFDLLLFFIERDEIDIYDIPIHQITQDFLEYINEIQEINMEMASDFILFVSTLMRIKSRMLLPRKEINEEGDEIDPREELVARLLEYKKFKDISAELSELEDARLQLLQRPLAAEQLKSIIRKTPKEDIPTEINLFELLQAFHKALENYKLREEKPQHVVIKYNYTMDGQKEFLIDWVKNEKKIFFDKIFQSMDNKIHAIFTFLAILELVQLKKLQIQVGETHNSFHLTWRESQEKS